MIIIVYCSRGSVFPALLAAISHCSPGLSPGRAWEEAKTWAGANLTTEGEPFVFKPYAQTSPGEIICILKVAFPLPLLKRTLQGLDGLIGNSCSLLPALCRFPCMAGRWRRGWGAGPGKACQREIAALVDRTLLQVELIKRQ